MPRVAESHKAARRDQILSAARACFGRRGLQATTIRDLEHESGLSSGAIFNYFSTKLDIFVALAEDDTAQTAELWSNGGLRAVIEGSAHPNPTYSATYLEVGRQLLTDQDFRKRWEGRGEVILGTIREHTRSGQTTGEIRTDVDLESLVKFSTVTLDGMMLQLRLGASASELETPLKLYEEAIAPPRSGHGRTARPARA